MNERVFCGIEGGASLSKLVLITESGKILTWVESSSTNHLLEGLDACQKTLYNMIETAKVQAQIPSSTVFAGLGLSMSGCEMDEANRAFEKNFLEKYPQVSQNCRVVSDTIGAILTASPKGGLVLISGTGSNALLLNLDGSTARCGGWGHLLGDEGSAMWISLKAVKMVFDEEDNFLPPPYDPSKVKELMLEHFNVEDKFGILEHCYVNFKKPFFAGLCAKLAKAALEGDSLCCYLFQEAGKVLALTVNAIVPKIQKELLEIDGGLPIICVGSVFKSWSLMKAGFVKNIDESLKEFTMMTLTCSAAIGAACLGAKQCNVELPIDCKKNTSVLYHGKW